MDKVTWENTKAVGGKIGDKYVDSGAKNWVDTTFTQENASKTGTAIATGYKDSGA